MEEIEVREKIRNVVTKYAQGANFTDDDSLTLKHGFDSLDFVEIVMDLEEMFDIVIPDEAGAADTCNKIYPYIAAELAKK